MLPMSHDPLGLAWLRMPMRSHVGVDAREQEPSQLHGHCTHPSWPKAPCVEPTGETERAAAAMHDAIGPGAQAHKVASVGPRRRHGRETESGGHEFRSPLHKASLEGAGMVIFIHRRQRWWPMVVICHRVHRQPSLSLLAVIIYRPSLSSLSVVV